MNAIESIFQNLKGTWQFERTINNTLQKQLYIADGFAIFSKVQNQKYTINYKEKGQLKLSCGKVKTTFTRKYSYRLVKGKIQIFFNDGLSKGKLFHKLLPTEVVGKYIGTKHQCNQDDYHAEYHFINKKTFTITYKAIGPRKDYTILTHFTKK